MLIILLSRFYNALILLRHQRAHIEDQAASKNPMKVVQKHAQLDNVQAYNYIFLKSHHSTTKLAHSKLPIIFWLVFIVLFI